MNLFKIEREIYTKVATAILNSFSSCRITNAFIYAPASFPAAAIVFSGDGMTNNMRDSSHSDNYRDVTITADVFTNKTDGKKTQAEDIMQIIIDTLAPLNFNLVSCKPFSELNNAQNYRITATFTATVDADGHIYTRK